MHSMELKTVATAAAAGILGLSAAGAGARGEDGGAKERTAAINGGLQWLAAQQVAEGDDEGSWDSPAYRPTVTSLAGLAFLANGYLPGEGRYGAVAGRALRYVMRSMAPDGYLGQGSESGMYSHAICTLFALSCLGMSGEPAKEVELAEWCRKSINVIMEAQRARKDDIARGGWRYTPHSRESDVSVSSWMLAALHGARQCGYPVDEEAVRAGLDYINRAFTETETDGGETIAGFLYRPGVSRTPEPGATAVAIFVKSLLEARVDEKIRRSLDYLEQFPPSWGGSQYHGFFFFVSFYLAQGMFQVGGDTWADFSKAMESVLLEHQEGDGRWPFPPDNARQSVLCGEAYSTSLAILILSLEKQYLPMYQRQARLF
jgi:hypothetical protein